MASGGLNNVRYSLAKYKNKRRLQLDGNTYKEINKKTMRCFYFFAYHRIEGVKALLKEKINFLNPPLSNGC